MPITTIESLDYSDPQNVSVDKLNNNFDEIVEFHGGTQGIPGPTGGQGEIGESGEPGTTGGVGARGTRWFVQSVQPSGPETTVVGGDFWVDSNNGNIFTFTQSGWVFTGYSITSSDDVFQSTPSTFAGGTGTSIVLDQILPENYLFILADKVSSSGILNEPLSKFMISTDSQINDAPILEFSKSNLEDGSLSDYSQHPVFKWKTSSPSDNSILLQIPGGSFVVGASGGFESLFGTLNIQASQSLLLDYGVSSNSGIYSTGGFFLNSPSGSFSIESNFFNITGASGNFSKPILLNPNLQAGVPSIFSFSGNSPAAFQSQRSGDSFQQLSHGVYHLSLENSSGKELSLNTKGKLLTKKLETGISYAFPSPGATATVGFNQVNWYFISRSGTDVNSSVLDFGNTIVITPSIPLGNYVGVGIYSDPTYSWTGINGLQGGQSIDINVLFSPNTFEEGISDGFKYIGSGATSGSVINQVTLPFNATSVDFTFSKGPTGNSTSVFYKAYGSAGGSGGSFLI